MEVCTPPKNTHVSSPFFLTRKGVSEQKTRRSLLHHLELFVPLTPPPPSPSDRILNPNPSIPLLLSSSTSDPTSTSLEPNPSIPCCAWSSTSDPTTSTKSRTRVWHPPTSSASSCHV